MHSMPVYASYSAFFTEWSWCQCSVVRWLAHLRRSSARRQHNTESVTCSSWNSSVFDSFVETRGREKFPAFSLASRHLTSRLPAKNVILRITFGHGIGIGIGWITIATKRRYYRRRGNYLRIFRWNSDGWRITIVATVIRFYGYDD